MGERAVFDALRDDGIDVRLGARLASVDGDTARLGDDGEVAFDLVLATVGRAPRTECLRLSADAPQVALGPRGHVEVDARQRTNVAGIWAAGDVTGQLALTSAAGAQGANVAFNGLLRLRRSFDVHGAPRAVFTDPQLGQVGLSERQARQARGDDVEVVRLPMAMVDRAVAIGRDAGGELRLVTVGGTRIVGASIVAPDASELLGQLADVLGERAGIARLAGARHAYPTMSEATQTAALQTQLAALAGAGATGRIARAAMRLLGARSRD